ncbi:RasGEF domain-containing protein [Pilaira anomala]|nr:RasGEF domain-containing protein [Pilaira anomala]
MQSVEAATSLFWDSDALARQIAVIDCQLYSHVLLDKRSLSQLDADGTKLVHLVDFHHYLTHSFAHQLIYWAELIKPENTVLASSVVPPVHTKDNLITHLVRVAYLLLHAYRDFSGFAAIMKALTVPEVRRLKKLWQPLTSRTKDMFRDLAQIIAPAKSYHAYHTCLRTKLEVHHHTGNGGMMIAVPWIQPHLLSIRSIVTAYTAGDDHDQQHSGDIVLSAPGAHKLNIELSILELCQHNSTIDTSSGNDFLLEDIFTTDKKSKRASVAASSKAIHIEGLRTAVIPVSNLNHLAPGDQLTHHWLVSRVYLRKDQLINESIEVEPLKSGESITCDKDEFEEAMIQQTKYMASRPVSMTSRRTSIVQQQYREEEEREQQQQQPVLDHESVDILPTLQNIKISGGGLSVSSSSNSTSASKQKSRLSPTAPEFVPGGANSNHGTSSVVAKKPASVITTTSDEKWLGYPVKEDEEVSTKDSDSERWKGYPVPNTRLQEPKIEDDDDDDEVWKGYPSPNGSTDSPRRASSQSETSEEWKGYHATKIEADWQRESALKVQEHEWQGYALETLDEDELDSSTMMDGEFEKSRQARGRQGNEAKMMENFQRKRQA